jgi:hypothetical protein
MFTSEEVHFLNFSTQELKKDRNATNRRKMPFLKQSYISFANPKLHEAQQFSKFLSKSLGPTV